MPTGPASRSTTRHAADAPIGERSGTTRISEAPIDLAAACRSLDTATGATGAVVTFTGVVRADTQPGDETPVALLEFECFAEMAASELDAIRTDALERFGLNGLTIHHRTGRLRVGEDIVLVAAAAAHRKEAFEAAAWAMDEIKRRVPIWKREHRADGTTQWVRGDACTCGADARPLH